MILPYSVEPFECSKCGWQEVMTKVNTKFVMGSTGCHTEPGKPTEEHLHVACPVCGYQYALYCKDKK